MQEICELGRLPKRPQGAAPEQVAERSLQKRLYKARSGQKLTAEDEAELQQLGDAPQLAEKLMQEIRELGRLPREVRASGPEQIEERRLAVRLRIARRQKMLTPDHEAELAALNPQLCDAPQLAEKLMEEADAMTSEEEALETTNQDCLEMREECGRLCPKFNADGWNCMAKCVLPIGVEHRRPCIFPCPPQCAGRNCHYCVPDPWAREIGRSSAWNPLRRPPTITKLEQAKDEEGTKDETDDQGMKCQPCDGEQNKDESQGTTTWTTLLEDTMQQLATEERKRQVRACMRKEGIRKRQAHYQCFDDVQLDHDRIRQPKRRTPQRKEKMRTRRRKTRRALKGNANEKQRETR